MALHFRASEPVPATTKIRRSRVTNVDTDRLQRRWHYLVDLVSTRSRELDTRMEWAYKVGELSVIEDELEKRGELPGERYTSGEWPVFKVSLHQKIEPDAVLMVPTSIVARWADPNVRPELLQDAEGYYLDSMWEGRGLFEGQGFRDHGFKNPIVVTVRTPTGQPFIVDGNHRLAMSLKFGVEEVPVRARELEPHPTKGNEIDLIAKSAGVYRPAGTYGFSTGWG